MAGLAALFLSVAGAASAASYNFDVVYSGSGVAALAPGSDPMVGTLLNTGDDFVYTLTGEDGGYWTSLGENDVFPFTALSICCGFSTNDLTLELKFGGSTVFSVTHTGVGTCCAHLGNNTEHLPAALVWDTWVLTDTVVSADSPLAIESLLPWPGSGPEQYNSAAISYTAGNAAVPEPASWALMILGFGLGGSVLRRRRTAVAN